MPINLTRIDIPSASCFKIYAAVRVRGRFAPGDSGLPSIPSLLFRARTGARSVEWPLTNNHYSESTISTWMNSLCGIYVCNRWYVLFIIFSFGTGCAWPTPFASWTIVRSHAWGRQPRSLALESLPLHIRKLNPKIIFRLFLNLWNDTHCCGITLP